MKNNYMNQEEENNEEHEDDSNGDDCDTRDNQLVRDFYNSDKEEENQDQDQDQDILNEGGALNQVSGENNTFELNDKHLDQQKQITQNNRPETTLSDDQMLSEKHPGVSNTLLNRNNENNKDKIMKKIRVNDKTLSNQKYSQKQKNNAAQTNTTVAVAQKHCQGKPASKSTQVTPENMKKSKRVKNFKSRLKKETMS